MLDENSVYAAVAARRTSFDAMVWQVPVLSLTAQAFLFTVALDSSSSRVARIIAAILSLTVSLLSITLMARHRQAELTDAHFIDMLEERGGIPEELRSSGRRWAARRDAEKASTGGWNFVPILPGYKSWVLALLFFGGAALLVLVLTLVHPESFGSYVP